MVEVKGSYSYFMPSTLDEVLEAVNSFALDDISVVDANGAVYGVLAQDSTFAPASSGSVDLWIGADYGGISMGSVEEALNFLQGVLTGLLFFPDEQQINEWTAVLDGANGGSYLQRACLLGAIQMRSAVEDFSELINDSIIPPLHTFNDVKDPFPSDDSDRLPEYGFSNAAQVGQAGPISRTSALAQQTEN